MSDFVSDFDPGPGGPLEGSAVIFDRHNFVSNCEQINADVGLCVFHTSRA